MPTFDIILDQPGGLKLGREDDGNFALLGAECEFLYYVSYQEAGFLIDVAHTLQRESLLAAAVISGDNG